MVKQFILDKSVKVQDVRSPPRTSDDVEDSSFDESRALRNLESTRLWSLGDYDSNWSVRNRRIFWPRWRQVSFHAGGFAEAIYGNAFRSQYGCQDSLSFMTLGVSIRPHQNHYPNESSFCSSESYAHLPVGGSEGTACPCQTT